MKNKKRRKKERSTKGALLRGLIEKIPRPSFEILKEELKEILKGNSGIYALYKNNKLRYVGLAKDLYNRTASHEKYELAGKWDHFSIFIVRRVKYLKDLETLTLSIANPKDNKIKGKLPKHRWLKEKLRQQAKKLRYSAEEIEKALR